jgi:glutathione S-transferase
MPLLRMYAITAIVLTFKMFTNSLLQGRGRVSSHIFTNPEDAQLFGGQLQAEEASSVQRAAKVWRNDLENIPIFLILAWIYVATGWLSTGAFDFYCIVFMVARILHTIFYLNAVQPWRTVVFTVGIAVTIALTIHLLIEVVFS